MAKIPLRAYVKEIENLIERGEIEQAVAHAKNILRAYPKHIETYRLLGKAFLESQRYSEAADILQRVLTVIPDDFVSQIGMSIIREDEGNLDAAIWHMERAYEVQPFNPAIQDELRRLYGRRDGSEPPKIRLTRGALVRMYTRGELYPQAIAETRAALAEDPQRLDMKVLLARLYYLSGLKNDAAETCSDLISKLPYCLEANRLLAEILPTTNRADETSKFQQRIFALDPYAAFVSPSAPTSDQVPDQAVMVEQFIWEPGLEESQQPDWARSVGVEWNETKEEVLPDWLNTLKPDAPAGTGSLSAPVSDSSRAGENTTSETPGKDEFVPDWMKQAGWAATDRRAEDIMAEQGEATSDEIAPAEIPDWLQSMAPEPQPEEAERTDWLESILETPSGTNGKEASQPVEPPAANDFTAEAAEPASDVPDWMAGLTASTQESAQPAEEAADLPDWLSTMQDESSSETPATEPENWAQFGEQEEAQPAQADDAPDWLKSFTPDAPATPADSSEGLDWASSLEEPAASEAAPAEDLPDWLKAMESSTDDSAAEFKIEQAAGEESPYAEAVDQSTAEAEPTSEAEVPDWLLALNAESKPAEETAQGDIPDWLLGSEVPAAASQDALDELSQPVDLQAAVELPETEDLPEAESLPEVSADIQETPLASAPGGHMTEPLQPIAEADSGAQELGAMPDLSDEDAMMAWLEGLAAKQGADEATLITPPEQRTETVPDWIQKEVAADQIAQASAEVEASEELEAELPMAEPAEAEESVEVPQMLEPTTETFEANTWPADTIEETQAEAASTIDQALTPNEFEAVEEAPAMPEETPQAEATEGMAAMPDFSDEAATMAWLESLAAKQGADEATLVTPPDQRTETPPDWVKRELEVAQQAEPEPADQPTADELPEVVDLPTAVELPTPEAEIAEPQAVDVQEMVDETTSEAVSETSAIESELPEWLETQITEEIVLPTEDAAAEIEQPADTTGGMPDFSDEAATMAWLESLAAKQGADEATLITPVDQRTETPPDWVVKEMETAQFAEAAAESEPEPVAQAEEPAAEAEIPAWLEEAVTPEAVTETPEEAEITQPIASQLDAAADVVEVQPVEEPAAEEPAPIDEFIVSEDVPLVTDEVPEWLKELETEEQPLSAAETENIQWTAEVEPPATEAVRATEEDSLPDWLQTVEPGGETSAVESKAENIPTWLMDLQDEGETSESEPEKVTSADDFRSAWETESADMAVEETGQEAAAPQIIDGSLADYQKALQQGQLESALAGYSRFIEDEKNLDDVIHDLRDALYRYPVEISIWQALGDAYAHNNQLQEALDAYTKAEELLR